MPNALTPGAAQELALGRAGTFGTTRDILKHYIWDTRTFGTTISDYTFFSQPIGAAWRNTSVKSVNETNLLDSGKLPTKQTFLVKRMGISLISLEVATGVDTPDLAQAFINIIQSSVFNLKVTGREFEMQVHGSVFLPAIMICGANQTNAGFRVGDIIASGWVSFDNEPLFLEPLVNFSVEHKLNNPDSNVQTVLNANATLLNGKNSSMQVRLEGVLTRAK